MYLQNRIVLAWLSLFWAFFQRAHQLTASFNKANCAWTCRWKACSFLELHSSTRQHRTKAPTPCSLLSLMLTVLSAVLFSESVWWFPWNQLVSIIFNRGTIKELCSYAGMCLMERGESWRERVLRRRKKKKASGAAFHVCSIWSNAHKPYTCIMQRMGVSRACKGWGTVHESENYSLHWCVNIGKYDGCGPSWAYKCMIEAHATEFQCCFSCGCLSKLALMSLKISDSQSEGFSVKFSWKKK